MTTAISLLVYKRSNAIPSFSVVLISGPHLTLLSSKHLRAFGDRFDWTIVCTISATTLHHRLLHQSGGRRYTMRQEQYAQTPFVNAAKPIVAM